MSVSRNVVVNIGCRGIHLFPSRILSNYQHHNAPCIILFSVHHENEELNQQVAKLQKENNDMQAKLSAMSNDSEKLGGLKVNNHLKQNHPSRTSFMSHRLLSLPIDGATNVGGGTPSGKVSTGIGQRKN